MAPAEKVDLAALAALYEKVGLGRDALRRRRVSGSRTCARVSVGYRVARTRRRCGTVDLD